MCLMAASSTASISEGGRQRPDLCGKVDHGFDATAAKDLQLQMKPLIRKTQPYTKKIAHGGIWVETSLLAEIEYRAKSAEGKVRHPIFKGLREDYDGHLRRCGLDYRGLSSLRLSLAARLRRPRVAGV